MSTKFLVKKNLVEISQIINEGGNSFGKIKCKNKLFVLTFLILSGMVHQIIRNYFNNLQKILNYAKF